MTAAAPAPLAWLAVVACPVCGARVRLTPAGFEHHDRGEIGPMPSWLPRGFWIVRQCDASGKLPSEVDQ